MPKKKSSLGPIWAVVIAGALLLVVVQFLPDKAGAQKLAHFFIAIALIAALANALKARRREETIPERIGEKGTCGGLCRERWP